MKSGTYDINWVQCTCGTSLGFVYQQVYGEAFAFKIGKVVIAQDSLMIRATPDPPVPPPPPPGPSASPLGLIPVASALAKAPDGALFPPSPLTPAGSEGFVLVEDTMDDDIIALD